MTRASRRRRVVLLALAGARAAAAPAAAATSVPMELPHPFAWAAFGPTGAGR